MGKGIDTEKAKDVARTVGGDVGHGLKGFFKAKGWMLLITLVILAVGIAISGTPLPFVIPIAIVIAIIDLLPVLGCGVVLLPWAAIALIAGNTYMCIVIAVTYVILLVGREIIEPKIMGDNIGVRPLVTFIFTVVGTWALGPLGLIVGPLAAVVITSIVRVIKSHKGK